MGWAEERASEIVEQMRSEQSLDIGRFKELMAVALQRVADECVEAVDNKRMAIRKASEHINMSLPYSIDRLVANTNRAIGCVDAEISIRARFPKEER